MRLSNGLGRPVDNGSARRGVDHWWQQRVTAVALVGLGVWFGVSLLSVSRLEYASLVHWIHQGWNAVLFVAFVLVVSRHSYLGLRVVAEDYVHHVGARTVALLVLQFAHVLLAVAGVLAVLKIAFAIPLAGDAS